VAEDFGERRAGDLVLDFSAEAVAGDAGGSHFGLNFVTNVGEESKDYRKGEFIGRATEGVNA
jgi:hypothetical protein